MLYYHILDKICVAGPKLLNFKMGGPILQNCENWRTKIEIKPSIYLYIIHERTLGSLIDSSYYMSVFVSDVRVIRVKDVRTYV
jgi:hypothetical protein